MFFDAHTRRKSELRRIQKRFLGCFSVSKRHFLIANRRSVSRCFAVSCNLVAVCVEGLDFASAETTGQISTECDQKSTDIDISMSFARTSMSFGDTFASLRARCKSRLASNRLRFFDCAKSCGWTLFRILKKPGERHDVRVPTNEFASH